MKYELKCTDHEGNTITSEFTATSRDELLQLMTCFLKGCSWHLNGLEFVFAEEENEND